MQIARLALFEVNEKMRGRCAETKAVGTEELSLGGTTGDVSPNRLGSLA
jgi:hypothetical protein